MYNREVKYIVFIMQNDIRTESDIRVLEKAQESLHKALKHAKHAQGLIQNASVFSLAAIGTQLEIMREFFRELQDQEEALNKSMLHDKAQTAIAFENNLDQVLGKHLDLCSQIGVIRICKMTEELVELLNQIEPEIAKSIKKIKHTLNLEI